MDAGMAVQGGSSVGAAATGEDVPKLARLATRALCRDWLTRRPSLDGLPSEMSKAVYKEVKSLLKRLERPVRCVDMFPFVRSCWHLRALDLSDAGRWVTDASLGALAHLVTLEDVRLTSCRFISDDGLSFAPRLPALSTLDVSWTEVGDPGVASHIVRIASLTSLNLTGLHRLSDGGVASLLGLVGLRKLSLASTRISDVALDYLTYYSRHPDPSSATSGLDSLRWLELSSTPLTDTGVGKLVAIIEDGSPYGRVFKQLEYLGLSSTAQVTTAAVRQVRTKYSFDAPLPNAPRTLCKSNAVALDAQTWVLRFSPGERQLPALSRSWAEERVVGYVAQYTKEVAASLEVIQMLHAVDDGLVPPPADSAAQAPAKRQRVG